MAGHPLLLFAAPETSQRQRRQGGGGGSNLRFPGARRQGDRLNPEFQRLAEAVEQLILAEDVMFLRPTGQWAAPTAEDLAIEEIVDQADAEGRELGSPVVALLDGLPLNGHRLLEGRLVVDDPDDYESTLPG